MQTHIQELEDKCHNLESEMQNYGKVSIMKNLSCLNINLNGIRFKMKKWLQKYWKTYWKFPRILHQDQ